MDEMGIKFNYLLEEIINSTRLINDTDGYFNDSKNGDSTLANYSTLAGMPSNHMPTEDDILFRKIVNKVDVFVVPIIILIGLVGNMLSLVIFTFTHLRRMSCSNYLSALAISDTGFLVCLFFSWSNNIGIRLYHVNVWCQIFVYLTYVWSFLSVWYVVAFTVERYIIVSFPFRRNEICTDKRAKIVVFCLALFAMFAYTFAFWTSGPQSMYGFSAFCSPLRQYIYLVTLVNNIDTAVTLIIPFLAILLLNAKIIFEIARFNANKYRTSMEESGYCQEESHAYRPFRIRRDELAGGVSCNTWLRTTNMLVIVSCTFLLLNLPSHVIRMYCYVMSMLSDTFVPSHRLVSTQKVCMYIYYCNFSVNFFLYSACGRNFRYGFKCLRLKVRRALTCQNHLQCNCCGLDLKNDAADHKGAAGDIELDVYIGV